MFTHIEASHTESILKPVNEKYREKKNQIKTKLKGKAPYTEKINTHVSSAWCVPSTFAYKNVDLLKMYCGKHCVEKLYITLKMR